VRTVLLVTRNFAPTSHVSVERALKLAKYLPQFGWHPTVLTGARATVGLPEDPALLEQVPEVEIIRARSPELSLFYGGRGSRRNRGAGDSSAARRGAPRRGRFHPKSWLVPDAQLLWHPFAVRAALRRAASARWDAVVATTFPPTALLIGRTIARRLEVPYVVDYRDSWTACPYYHVPVRPGPVAELERRLEAATIRGAAAVVAVDERMVAHALERIDPGERPPCHLIPNGYDEEDFREAAPAQLPAFSIVHTGQLRRSPQPIWDALAATARACAASGSQLHFWQVGFVDPRAVAGLSAPPPGIVVHQVPPVSQREAIGYMLGADLLVVEEFESVMPSKTLQYLRAARPLLALTEQGGLIRDVLEGFPDTHLVPRDRAGRAGPWIAEIVSRGRMLPRQPHHAVIAYSRRDNARRFSAVLDDTQHSEPAARTRPVGIEIGAP
jgi:glycosyltransferase involved in cell wall biosynthesis